MSVPEHSEATDSSLPVPQTLLGTLSTGETATVVAFDGTLLEARSSRPFAPGARALIQLSVGNPAIVIDLKCFGSKLVETGVFHVRGRVISLPRAQRDQVASALANR